MPRDSHVRQYMNSARAAPSSAAMRAMRFSTRKHETSQPLWPSSSVAAADERVCGIVLARRVDATELKSWPVVRNWRVGRTEHGAGRHAPLQRVLVGVEEGLCLLERDGLERFL